uniref:JmjC domain-containing protein n=1 Tax=Macrostomum lignano TaxID=282301 RepID=A0A1I8F8H3_9PLAT
MSTGNDIERRQKFLDDLVAAVRDGSAKENAADPESSEKSSAELARYALLRVQLARSEARLKIWRTQTEEASVENVTDFVSDTLNQRCLLSAEDFIMEMSRAPVNCGMCKDMREMPVEYNMTRELFLKKYAYTPVLSSSKTWSKTGAPCRTSAWTSQEPVRLEAGLVQGQDDAGQFFAYKTEFGTLREALHMSEERRRRTGTSAGATPTKRSGRSCGSITAGRTSCLRMLSPSRIDWICSWASPGRAPSLHIDYVSRPSWQAQIRGRKIWELVPSPECASVCHSFNITTVHAGDIINIDTNRWYHATYVYPARFQRHKFGSSTTKLMKLH